MSKNLENKNEELNHTIQDLENKLAAECKERERAQEEDHIEREKQLETLKQSMREEMLNMIGAQPTATQKDAALRAIPGNVNTNSVMLSGSSLVTGLGQRIISSQQLRQSALKKRSQVGKDGYI